MKIIIFYLLLIDSLVAVFLSFFGEKWYIKHFRILSRFVPLKKAWVIYYLILVFWIGYLTLAK